MIHLLAKLRPELFLLLVALLLLGVVATDAWTVAEVSAASVTVDIADETPPQCGEGHGPETCYWQLGLRDDAYLICEGVLTVEILADNALRIRCEVRE